MHKSFVTFSASLSLLSASEESKPLIDFKAEKNAPLGAITNDGVMGGLSKGKLKRNNSGSVTFSGTLSLENNGGFSLWRIAEGNWNLSDAEGVSLRVKGDGRTYKIRFSTNERYRFGRVSFQADLPTKKNEWTNVTVSFSALKASWRGRQLENKFDPAEITEMGIILADKTPGSFTLEMEKITKAKKE